MDSIITDATGNLLEAEADALVNTVNTVGVMGKGIALQFKTAFPDMFADYKRAADNGEVALGRMNIYATGRMTPRFIINFPTKGHWRSKSRLADIRRGLDDLVAQVESLGLSSIAIPPLGCGNGGLEWAEVRPVIVEAFEALPDLEVLLYAPSGSPTAAEMVNRTQRPTMTRGRAALVAMLTLYAPRVVDVSIIEVQKLMYFLQEAGEPLQLNYAKDRYGPYADNLRHVLNDVEGHLLIGYGDASAKVHSAEPIRVLAGALDEAERLLADAPELTDRISHVLDLVTGFESPYALELLSTVHWVAVCEAPDAADDPPMLAKLVGEWSTRKERMFVSDHVVEAWEQLRSQGWLRELSPA